jgi:hypothetical protein
MIKNFKWVLIASLAFVACNNEDEVTIDSNSSDGKPLTAGSANFSKYVALGDSFAAGFSDGALFIEAQKGAYPNILAQQFALAGGGAFTTPFMADNVGGFLGSAIYTPRLYFNGTAPSSVALPPFNQVATTTFASLGSTYNNMGIPGAKSFHLLAPGYGSAAGNPYFARFATNAGTTVIADAIAQSPTFFSLWIGGNDVLGYATSGGTGKDQKGNLNPATYASNDITDPTVFANVYNNIVTAMTAKGAKGVVANLPYVTALPFFTTVPTNAVPGLSPSQAGQLNQLFGGINAALAGASLPARFATIVADDGNPQTTESNPLLILDESLPNISAQITAALTPSLGAGTAAALGGLYGQARHASSGVGKRDFILLTARSVIGTPQAGAPAGFNTIGVTFPMGDGTALTNSEFLEIKTATDAYNATIESVAKAKGLAFVELKGVTDKLASGGIVYNGFNTTSTFVTGGMFSLDGVHPSPRGYAIISNLFAEAINAKYGSNFKSVNVGQFRILYPASL